jgi:uncharacterized repeat protein (TIGR01451 family)
MGGKLLFGLGLSASFLIGQADQTVGQLSRSSGAHALESAYTGSGGWQYKGTWTVSVPDLKVTSSHNGSFTQGQSGATYTITVSNIGSGASSGTVTVTENVPSGMTLVSMSGSGWSCPGTAANNCTRNDSLPAGQSFLPIVSTVNVASDASSPLGLQLSVFGGGSAAAAYTDSTIILTGVALLSQPAAGSTLSSPSATFSWTAVGGADQYWLDVGNTVGGSDLWRGALTGVSQLVTGLPCDGRTIYAQLFTHSSSGWSSPQRYTYTAPTGCLAVISSPAGGTALDGASVTFTWNAVIGADQYWLDVGSTLGGSDLWRGALTGTSQLASGMPCDGRSVYAQLFTHSNGAWSIPQRYTYTASSGCFALISSPVSGTLAGASVTFTWNAAAGADQYWLDVGSTLGGSDLWRGALTGTSQAVSSIPCDSRTVYVQLFTHGNTGWSTPQRYVYTAPAGCYAQIATPVPGTVLPSTIVTIAWSHPIGADQYWLDVGSTLGGSDLWRGALTGTSQTVTGLPCDGRTVFVQLFTHTNGAWQVPLRYTYSAKADCLL